jgi:hypothetical protein
MDQYSEIINGKLEPFFETGTEGILWSLYDDKNNGYNSLHVIKNGDFLEVINENNELYWSGLIMLEYKRRFTSYPNNPKYGQQEIFGYWVHGFQEKIEPEYWSKMFFDKMTAILKKK